MPFDLPELLRPYLLPLLIAVPLAILVILISIRRGDEYHRSEFLPSRFEPTQLPPAAAGMIVQRVPAMPVPVQPKAPLPVMVVDDSAVVRAKLGKLLQSAGYQVVVARDGVEALDLLGQQHVALLITDLEMPNKDGFELIADVQGSLDTEDLPIIAITGHEELQGRVHQVQGIYGIFKKPWNDRDLLKRVEALVSLRRPAPAQAA
ncbi:response regulator [Paucibacter sp. APW11]|uniref:Response regulator n=1 Tax=Roseateles aquae TaxID=3077235 RepID=A0ABU3PIN2_9BURK|nr:response regulator [Paucibacter sp. APW11]MDT9002415.1 response regulator [Paucibacter sp. APW11]